MATYGYIEVISPGPGCSLLTQWKGSGESVGWKIKTALHRFENFRPATMEDETANLPHMQVAVSEEVLDGAAEFCIDKLETSAERTMLKPL